MKKNLILSLVSFAGVVAFSLLWSLLQDGTSVVFGVLTIVCAGAFVWAVRGFTAPQRKADAAQAEIVFDHAA